MACSDDPAEHPRRWYSTNLVGVPAPVLGGLAFQQQPRPLAIAGVREAHARLFALLERSADADEAREMFVHYMNLAFGLLPPAAGAAACAAERRRWKTSWAKLLQGWGLDANGAAGAVLKGWVESRFGLVPSFHGAPLARFPSPAWVGYLEQKSASRWHNNSIWQQLDLVYEFCQWMLSRRGLLPEADGLHVRLWRGSNRVEEQLVSGSLRQRQCVLRLNNLLSFARSREQAECFGDWVFEVRVPLAKLVYVPGLARASLLQGEAEVIALGGDYQVEARYAC